jgi:signal transduction histidine kinase
VKLRGRLALTVTLIAAPVVVGLSLFALSARRQALLESIHEATVQRMEAGGRALCEARRGPFGRPRPPRAFARRGRRRGRAPRLRRVYDEGFRPLLPRWEPLRGELREALESGADVAGQWLRDPRRVRIAMRMPWDGPCAVVLVERPVGPLFGWAGFAQALGWSSLAAALTVLAALLALGPVVRRVRRLTAAVRAQAASGYERDVEVAGADEVTELARAFNEAGAEIRKRLAELSARDEALTEFLASTTHDVMIPLTVLQGHLSDLSKAADRGAPPDREKVAGALAEAHYLGSLLRNLSAAARLDAGEPMLARHRFDLRELVERVVSRHRPIADGKGVSLDHAVPEAPVEVEADSTLAEQAVSNLVSNAVAYNARGGHVAVVLERRRGGRFEIRVMDDGPGIPAEELARVSERRFRGGAARTRAPSGLGLGLHIVRDVADRHGWSLRFSSPPDGGLTVTLEGAAR